MPPTNLTLNDFRAISNGTYNAGQIAIAFINSKKDDVNHQDDGHRKERTNRL